jgi:hypothetical protein
MFRAISLVLLVLLSGCGVFGVQRSVKPVHDGRSKLAAPPPGHARLVISGRDFRERGMGELPAGARIANGQGAVIGEVNVGFWMTVDVPPGPQTLVAWHDQYFELKGPSEVAVLCGSFDEGRTYFLALGPKTVGLNVQELAWAVDTSPGGLTSHESGEIALVVVPEKRDETQRLFADRIARAVTSGNASASKGACVQAGPAGGRSFASLP